MTPVIAWPAKLPTANTHWRLENSAFVERGILSGSVRLFQGRDRITAMASAALPNADLQDLFNVFLADLRYGASLALLFDWHKHKSFDFDAVATNDSDGVLIFTSPLSVAVSAKKSAGSFVVAGFEPFKTIKRGGTIRIDGIAYVVRHGVQADGAGVMEVGVAPRIRAYAALGTPVYYPGDFGLFQLVAVEHGESDADREGFYSLQFVQTFEDEHIEGLTLENIHAGG